MTQQPKIKFRQDYQSPDFTITTIDLVFLLAPEITTVTAKSHITRINSPISTLTLVGEKLKLLSVIIDDKIWPDYQEIDGELHLFNTPADFTLTIINEITPINNTALEGLYVSGNALCTQCEAEGFRRITYYLDRPDVLACFTTKIIADKQKYPHLLSNGNRIAQGDLENGQHWVQWQDPFPKPSYLFALVAGDFDILRDTYQTRSGRQVNLELYVDKGNLDSADWAMTSLKNAMKWDEIRFNLEYDLDIFMIVAVDFFNMGAMENKGLNIFNSKYVLAKAETATDSDYLAIESVIGHEYFHNWTGNRITCRDWFQLSLKEGLTVFRDQEFSSDRGSRSLVRIENTRIIRGAQFAEDASPMAHPIRPDQVMEMNNFYTVTVYEKGSEVIRMIHTLLGEDKFQAGMQLYIQRYDGQAATCDEFVQAMQDASNVDLTLFRRWYSQSGTPLVTVTDHYDAGQQTYQLTVTQQTLPTHDQADKLPLHIPLDIELYATNGDVIPLCSQGKAVNSVLNITQAQQQFIFEKVKEKPIISLLREFSAPIKLNYSYSDDQLIFIMKNATNDFSRWDASQQLLAKYIQQFVTEKTTNPQLPIKIVAAYQAILLSDTLSPALIAQILTVQTENEIAELFTFIDPDAIHFVRRAILHQLAVAMEDEFFTIYLAHQTPTYAIDHQDISKRALKNCCLFYLALGQKTMANTLVTQQYQQADNMTDMIATLTYAVYAQLSCCDALLQDFDARWYRNGLVMDKWFTLQATSPSKSVLATVKSLLDHRSFNLNNPNRIRALIGAFVSGNSVAFHAKDGSGYRFLTEMICELNQRNPQIASRLIEPLIRFKRYDVARQQLMQHALLELKKIEHLSPDLYEKISKALCNSDQIKSEE